MNADSALWTGIKVAIERVESLFDEDEVKSAVKLVKTIGVINLLVMQVCILARRIYHCMRNML